MIAERTGLAVVSDFRVRDVAAGGQGAPLVPIADALLFAGDGWRALQNVGGIGNVTVVPPDGTLASVRAFDTGPGNVVIDAVVRRIDASKRYDDEGRMAASGTPIAPVIDELLAHPYFAAEPPKSTGRELFDDAYVARLIERCRAAKRDASDADIVATATALTARSIADAYARFLPEPITEVLVSGGGSRNATLVRCSPSSCRRWRCARSTSGTSMPRRRKRWPSRCSRCCISSRGLGTCRLRPELAGRACSGCRRPESLRAEASARRSVVGIPCGGETRLPARSRRRAATKPRLRGRPR